MASGQQFAATVDAWVAKSEARMRAVFQEASQRVVSVAQSRIPRDTGFARASVRASLQSMPPIDPANNRPKDGGPFPYDGGEISAVISNAKLGDQIFVGWTASYVAELERGHSKQAPSGFVRLAAMEWNHIVEQVVNEAKSRAA